MSPIVDPELPPKIAGLARYYLIHGRLEAAEKIAPQVLEPEFAGIESVYIGSEHLHESGGIE
jgi:hypothetical protein